MSITTRAMYAAAVVAALSAITGALSTASAQRGRPTQREAERVTRPSSGISVSIDGRGNDRRMPSERRNNGRWVQPRVYYVPVPVYYTGYSSRGHGGGVYDTNGRPLGEAYEVQANQYGYGVGTPDLSGTPYVVGDGGAMVVDFGDGLRRSFASCAALSANATPDGHSRTVFYQLPADGIILRAGQSGRVRGTPPGGVDACYAVDAYGRTELRY